MTLYLITKIKTGEVYPAKGNILLRYDNLLLCPKQLTIITAQITKEYQKSAIAKYCYLCRFRWQVFIYFLPIGLRRHLISLTKNFTEITGLRKT